MAGLLVSVRSAVEARATVDGGATIVDVKEPRHGPLGMADVGVWRSAVEAVDGRAAMSVALGELLEREREDAPVADTWTEIGWRKLGLAGCGRAENRDWRARWAALRDRWGDGPGWVAVVYADFEAAESPTPDAVVDEAVRAGCVGVLFDTWEKGRRTPIEAGGEWAGLIERVRGAGLLVVIAGGLDVERIERLKGLRPDYFGVRGAACGGGDRRGVIDVDRVGRLARAAAG